MIIFVLKICKIDKNGISEVNLIKQKNILKNPKKAVKKPRAHHRDS